MTVPLSALTLAYWLHMLATVILMGGMAAFTILVLPEARKILSPLDYASFLERIQKRLDPLGWLSLAVLAGTGLVQMSANPNYQGFLSIQNRWAVAILVKHLVFFSMLVLSAYMSWGVLPRLRRLAMHRLRMETTEALSTQAVNLARQEAAIYRISFLLGILILALTAIARAS